MLIAFGHRRYVGKDTAVRFMLNHLRWEYPGITTQKITFAYTMKEHCYELFQDFGLKTTEYYEQHPEEKDLYIPTLGRSARDVWIKYGNACREIETDVWTNLALKNPLADIVFVTDMRFPNEADCIIEQDGFLVRIDRPDVDQFDDGADSELSNYSGWTHIIKNNGLLSDFHKTIITFTEQVVHDRFAHIL
jgi:hypothetical protein